MEHSEEGVPDGVSPAEMRQATEIAFMQVKAVQGSSGPLEPKDQVIYRSPGGRLHTGPFMVVSMDAKTVLIAGFMNGNPAIMELRVFRTEVVRVCDAKGIVHRILSDAHPCPVCRPPGKEAPKAN